MDDIGGEAGSKEALSSSRVRRVVRGGHEGEETSRYWARGVPMGETNHNGKPGLGGVQMKMAGLQRVGGGTCHNDKPGLWESKREGGIRSYED